MSTSLKTAAASHAEHRQWQSDLACWKDDIENWRLEHSEAVLQLQDALNRIKEHGTCLDDHADSLASLQSSLEYHEKNLAASLQRGSDSALDETLNERHRKEADLHQRQKDAHERMKKHHHQAMSKVSLLTKALQEAC